MTVKPEETIKREIRNFVRKNGGIISRWYVGITEDPEQRLDAHNVLDSGPCVSREANSHIIARRIEKHFHGRGADGAPGGGDEDAVHVYAYRKQPHTRQ